MKNRISGIRMTFFFFFLRSSTRWDWRGEEKMFGSENKIEKWKIKIASSKVSNFCRKKKFRKNKFPKKKMLSVVERKDSRISWPVAVDKSIGDDKKNARHLPVRRNLSNDFRGKEITSARERVWQRNSKGLFCALGQLGCNDSHYSPDTIGTWKFHRVPRPR